MKSLSYFAVTDQVVATHPVHVLKIEGVFLGATTDQFLQVHDSRTAPAANAVPLKQWPIQQGSPFFQTFSAGELALANGLYVCVSTTDGTYTLSSDDMDLSVELTDPEQPSGTSVANNTGSHASMQVWATGAGPKTLLRLTVKETNGTDGYIFVFADNDTIPVKYLGKVNASSTREFNFGAGFVPFRTDGNGAQKNGCSIIVYEDFARTTVVNIKGTFTAEYK